MTAPSMRITVHDREADRGAPWWLQNQLQSLLKSDKTLKINSHPAPAHRQKNPVGSKRMKRRRKQPQAVTRLTLNRNQHQEHPSATTGGALTDPGRTPLARTPAVSDWFTGSGTRHSHQPSITVNQLATRSRRLHHPPTTAASCWKRSASVSRASRHARIPRCTSAHTWSP